MKKILILLIWIFTMSFIVNAQTTKTVGGSGANYATLKLAFDAINNGSIKGVIILQITGSTTETASAVLNASGNGSANYTSVTIYPTITGITITGNLAAPLIDLNGADNVTFDGRVNATGSAKDMILTNTNTGTSASTIRYINSAENNTIKYCTIKGASTNTTGGIIFFSTATAGNGNDGDIIDNCNITKDAAGRPINAIYSAGTAGRENSGITISNNNIYDIWRTASSSYSIQLAGNTTTWTISSNSFYETTTLVPTGNYTYNCIRIVNASGNGFTVSGNYMGGQAAQCGGSALTVNAATTHLFQGIYLSVGTTTTSSIQGNIIQNFSYTSTNTTPWQGININAGNVNIGDVTGNIIGAATGTGSITMTGQVNNTNVYGINIASTGTINCQYNTIGSITVANSNATYASNFYGIYKSGAGTITISNNSIGSTTTANSIITSSTSTASVQILNVIYSAGTGTSIISNNTLANMTNAGTYYESSFTTYTTSGIATFGGSNSVTGNIIHHIACNNFINIGVLQQSKTASTNQTISGNTIYELSNNNLTGKGWVYGIYYDGPTSGTNVINGNFIHSLNVASSDNTSEIDGIDLISGLVTCANNIINLGSGNTKTYLIAGIWENGVSGQSNSVYFNSIYISGNPSGTTTDTYAYFKNSNSGTTNLRNNIFFNARSGGSTGKHYSIVLQGVASTTIDYNDYIVSGTGGVLGKIGTLDKSDLAAWKLGTSQDVHSLSLNPGFTTAGGTSALNYYTSATMPGVSGTGVTTDYAGLTRGSTPKMGAFELNNYTWQGSISTNFGTAGNWTNGAVPPDGSDIYFAASPNRNCILDQTRTLKSITNAQSTYKLLVNGKQLTIIGDLNFTNGAQIDATATSSIVVFAGTSAQNIPSGSFVSNTLDGLRINNSNGLTLAGNLTVNQTLTLTNGAFLIGANTLTLNGAISTSSGTLTGGSSTNIVIGGSSASTTLPTVTLNNLTLNRANGISLGGPVNIAGTLVLTNGTLALGANTLTISGNSPTRTSGNINASNAGATLTFANPTAITLPSSIFSSDVNNLTINGAGGVTASSDFTVNGVFNLQSANPSATKGSLDMWDGSAVTILTMGANATTIGLGDVTGIIKRTSFVANTTYSFGNQFTTLIFAPGGTYPSQIQAKVSIGTAPSWAPTAIKRLFDIMQAGANNCFVTITYHYLDSELNGNDENNLSHLVNAVTGPLLGLLVFASANHNSEENWDAVSNANVGHFETSFGGFQSTMKESSASICLWNGQVSSSWTNAQNWTPSVVPDSTSIVRIPDSLITLNDPILPTSTKIATLSLDPHSILNAGVTSQLTINGGNGAWHNAGGIFNASTSNVIFTNANATMSGTSNFYNVTIANGAALTPGISNIMRIAGAITLEGTGILNAGLLPNTIEYNDGSQTVINPNGTTPGYYNLILSGTGTKTLPGTALSVLGDLTMSGAATVTAGAAMTIGKNLTINTGSSFITGNYSHSIGGNFDNNGTITATAGNIITMNGPATQNIEGSSTSDFDNLTINNSSGVNLFSNINVNNVLTLSAGNLNLGAYTLGINGTISKTSGIINVTPLSSMSFCGTGAITLTNDLFTAPPSINNLTINRTGWVALGNQNMTINGLLDLQSGTFSLGADTLTIAGVSPTRTSGNIDASNATSNLIFTNIAAITLPASIFTGNVSNLTINGTGGVTASSDFTIDGVLNLQSVNPSTTKGILEMWDGSEVTILTMGTNATTIGLGDVTGIVKRTSFVANTEYSFGNQFTTITFANGGTYPSQIQAKISIGTAPSWKPTAIKRLYDIMQTGAANCLTTVTYHYLDAELNGNNENKLVHLLYGNPGPPSGLTIIGSSNHNAVDNWVSVSNAHLEYFETGFGALQSTVIESDIPAYTWNGSTNTSWGDLLNWTPNGVPVSTSNVIIPDASTTPYSPTLTSNTEIQNLTIGAAGILNLDPAIQLTINGSGDAWSNIGGTFNPNTSNVIFTNANATISGTNNFYNVTIANGAALTLETENIMRIAGALTLNGTGILEATLLPNTIEFNGVNQAVINPNGLTPGYHNLILSGSGTKTLPSNALEILGNFTMSGTATSTLTSSMTVDGNLSLANGNGLTLTPPSRLTVSGTLTNNAGASGLVLESDSSSTASLIHFTPNVQATVERYIVGSSWHYMFSPLSALPTTTYTKEGTYTNYNFYSYNEATENYWNSTTNFGTTGWTYEYTHTNLPTTKGYIYNRYNFPDKIFSQTGGSLFVGQKDFTVNYTVHNGTIGNGVTQGWSTFDGWNLIGNPYTSAINWDSVPKDDIEAGAYFYDGNNYQYYVSGGGSSQWNVGITLNGGSKYIPAGQGFFVKVKNTGITHSGTVSIPESARVHNSQPFYKNSAVTVPNILKLNISSGNATDETVIRTVPDAKEEFDASYDANKQFSWNKARPQIYSQNTYQNNFAVNAIPEINENRTVQLGLFTGSTGSYSINVKENSFTEYYIWLEDKYSGTYQNISINKTYSFSQETGNNTGRFVLHFKLNHAPTALAIPNQSIYKDSAFNMVIPQNTFADIDSAEQLTISAKLSNGNALPKWLSFDASKGKFYGVPDKKQNIEVAVSATDLLGKSVKSTFTIDVLSINHAPISSKIPDQSIYVNNNFDFTIPKNTFNDIDPEDTLNLSASMSNNAQLPNWLNFDASTGRFYGLPYKEETIAINVTATDILGKSTKSTFTIEVIDMALSVENQEIYSVVIYPNPSAGVFKIESDGLSNPKLIISDMMGRIILQKELTSRLETVDLSNSSKGIVFIEIRSDKGIIRKKMEIQ